MNTEENVDLLTGETLTTINLFNEAVNQHDLEKTMALMTADCVFENTFPPPDGERFEGQARVRSFWKDFFASSPHSHFEAEEIFAYRDRAVVRWRYEWVESDEKTGHVRGVDVFKVKSGKVAEKLAYVKG